MLDAIDCKLLETLQANARVPNAELARLVNLAPSAVLERVRKLEERGVVRGYHAAIDPERVAAGLLAFIFVRTDERCGAPETAAALSAIEEVLEVHDVAGEDCFLIKVRTADTESLGRLLRERISVIPAIRSTRTTIVLHTAKESCVMPIPGQRQETHGAR